VKGPGIQDAPVKGKNIEEKEEPGPPRTMSRTETHQEKVQAGDHSEEQQKNIRPGGFHLIEGEKKEPTVSTRAGAPEQERKNNNGVKRGDKGVFVRYELKGAFPCRTREGHGRY